MDEPIMSFDGNGQPDVLSLINSEAEKVELVYSNIKGIWFESG